MASIRPFPSDPKRWHIHRPGSVGFPAAPPVSTAASLGLTLALQPAGPTHILDRMWLLAPGEPKTAPAESESEDCVRLKWLLDSCSRCSGMSRLTFEEKASTVGHVHSMILGGW